MFLFCCMLLLVEVEGCFFCKLSNFFECKLEFVSVFGLKFVEMFVFFLRLFFGVFWVFMLIEVFFIGCVIVLFILVGR